MKPMQGGGCKKRKREEEHEREKRQRGIERKERGGTQARESRIFCRPWLQGGYYANLGGQTVRGGGKRAREKNEREKRQRGIERVREGEGKAQ